MNTFVRDEFAYLKDAPTFDGSILVTGTINSQTISSAASFTGTVAIVGALTVGGNTTLSAGGVLTLEAGGKLTTETGNDLSLDVPSTRQLLLKVNAVTVATMGNTGGFILGSATGGDKGLGTLNAAADIYKNNTAYTNPDYVFEHFYTGRVERFAANEGAQDYRGLVPLRELEAHVRQHYRFPLISDQPLGVFGRTDVALALVEELALYLFDHERRVTALENANGA